MRSIAYKGVRSASLALLFVLTLAACGAEGHAASAQLRTAPAPLKLSLGSTDRYVDTTPQSMCSTLLTAEVVVGSHGASQWNTLDGRRPQMSNASDAGAIVRQGYFIYTRITFSTFHALIDRRPHVETQFATIGGMVGQDQFDGSPYPQLEDGGHYVLIFAPAAEPTTHRTDDLLIVYQAFPIDAQGMVTLQQAGSPHELGSGTPQPEITLSLADLSQQLAKC